MSNIKIVFPPDEYPDSYQNDYIEEVLRELYPHELVHSEGSKLLQHLADNELRIGWVNRDEQGLLHT